MSENKLEGIEYAHDAFLDVQSISMYLLKEFGLAQVDAFEAMLDEFHSRVLAFPYSGEQVGSHRHFRRSVLSRECTAYYFVRPKAIQVVAVRDNRQDSTDLRT